MGAPWQINRVQLGEAHTKKKLQRVEASLLLHYTYAQESISIEIERLLERDYKKEDKSYYTIIVSISG